ncbi:19923_t:CDS:2 [Entrophospora sp. SA101]|nr:8309_t:CDS:2 [Entrophospora sp. SA101]CAJ0748898.1 19923_t:CDS:2 [Entrophospora sp. SA101]CAJ0862601.1 12035_t:CDS:2 [Entrophospora sp. SA101]
MLLAHKDVFSPFYITQIKTIQSPSTSETGSGESQDTTSKESESPVEETTTEKVENVDSFQIIDYN